MVGSGECAELIARVEPLLHTAGFDLVAPLEAGWYNAEEHIAPLPDCHKLPGPAGALCLLVANTGAVWEPFLRWTADRLDKEPTWLDSPQDALDQYTVEVVQRAVSASGIAGTQVVYAYETLEKEGRSVSVTTAAHVAGLAHYHQESQRSVHARFGPWIAYRALIVFPSLLDCLGSPPAAPADPCSSAEWQRVGELQRVCFEQWDETEEQLNWKRLVEIVEAFQLGKEYKYTPEQLHFHYQPDELLRARHLRRCAVPELVTGT